MTNNITSICCSDQKVSAAFDVVRHALDAAHQMSKVKLQTAEIREALQTSDYDFCFNTAQKFLKKYRNLINSYAFLTDVVVIDITLEESRSKDITYWQSSLRFVEMLLYANEAIECGLKSVIEEKLRKIFLPEDQTKYEPRC